MYWVNINYLPLYVDRSANKIVMKRKAWIITEFLHRLIMQFYILRRGDFKMNYLNEIDKVIKRINDNMEKIQTPDLSGSAKDGLYSRHEQAFLHPGQWTFSFHTGMVFLAYKYTGDVKYIKYLNQFDEAYDSKVYKHSMLTMHDLGFLYSLYSVARFKTTGDMKARETALKAADELGKRFNINCRAISAWGRMNEENVDGMGLVIADCMMNLPLLFWAWQETGHIFYRDVAMAHADTTSQFFVREDNSLCHAYKFDPESGLPEKEANYCGYSVGSAWARGTAWAIYGYAIAYRYTGKKAYLDTSIKLAEFFISNLPEDFVPVWDFRLPENEPKKKDTSALAVTACGLLELSGLAAETSERYKALAVKMIESLSSDRYTALNEDVEAILWTEQYRSEKSACQYGDYFYVEALIRIATGNETFW